MVVTVQSIETAEKSTHIDGVVKAMKDAIDHGDLEAVNTLIKRGADINMIQTDAVTGSQHSILILAITVNKYDIARLILSEGAAVDTIYMNYDIKNQCIYGLTALDTTRILYEVSLNSNVGEILHSIEESLKNYMGREPTIVPPKGLPDNMPSKVIIDAVTEGDTFSVELLVNHGMDVNTIEMDETGNKVSILISAISQWHMDVAKLLIERGANVATIFQNINEETGKTYEVTALNMATRRHKESTTIDTDGIIQLIEQRLRKSGVPETIVSTPTKVNSERKHSVGHHPRSKITAWLQKPVPIIEVDEASSRGGSSEVDSYHEEEINGNAKKYTENDTSECTDQTTTANGTATQDNKDNTVQNSKMCVIL